MFIRLRCSSLEIQKSFATKSWKVARLSHWESTSRLKKWNGSKDRNGTRKQSPWVKMSPKSRKRPPEEEDINLDYLGNEELS